MELMELAKRFYRAYETGDRAFVESSLTPDFTFTSPFDDAIGRDAYMARCWPNHENIASFDFVAIAQDGDGVLVLYQASLKKQDVPKGSKGFRNAEYLRFENGKLKAVEVFFGDPPRGLSRKVFAAESGAA